MKRRSVKLLALLLCVATLVPLGAAAFASGMPASGTSGSDTLNGSSSTAQVVTVPDGETTKNVTVDIVMLDGAAVSFSSDKAALRFVCKIDKAGYSALDAAGDVKVVMSMLKTDDVDKLHGYVTAEAFEKAGLTPAATVNVGSWFAETSGYYYAAVEVSGIKDYTEAYSAVAYAEVSVGDAKTYVCAPYDEKKNSRCIYDVAFGAYEDRSTEKGYAGYTNGIDGTYSPYDKKALASLTTYLDKVVSVEAGIAGSAKFTPAGTFYAAPYEVTYKTNGEGYDVTVTSKNSFDGCQGVYVAGNAVEDAAISGNTVKFSVDDDRYMLYVEPDEQGSTWCFVNASSDNIRDAEHADFPEAAPNGEISGFKWSYASSKSIVILNDKFPANGAVGYNGASVPGRVYSYTNNGGYYDLSDFVNLSFYVYVPKGYEGATAYFQFSSENPATADGTDYYGKTVRFSNPGWNKITVTKSTLSVNRVPLGWDKIQSLQFTMSGWSQVNNENTVLYFTSMYADDLDPSYSKLNGLPELTDSAVFADGGYCGIIDCIKYPANPEDDTAVVFKENDIYYIPVNCFAAALDEDAEYYSLGSILKFDSDGISYEFSEGKYYKKNGTRTALKHPAKQNGKALFISTDDIKEIFGYSDCHIDTTGLVVFSNGKTTLDSAIDYDNVYDMYTECLFVRPTGEQIVSDLDAFSGGQHPYLMMNEKNFEDLRFWFEMDETLKNYVAKLEASYGIGSSKFNAAVNVFRLTDGVRLLSISRDVMEKLLAWSVLYKLYEKTDTEKATRYKERIWLEANAAANFVDPATNKKSWHPDHFLDTAELAYPMAIAYDWLYDVWTPAQRTVFEDAMFELALKQTSVLGGKYALGGATNNWNGVCNGGIMCAALALVNVERYRSDVIKVIDESILDIEKGMWVYGPDGGYEEGPGYWAYGTTYVHVFISSLDTACGKDYGLYSTPGFAHSVYFTTYLGSVNSAWGFHDNGSGSGDTNIAQWFAVRSGDGNVSAIRRDAIKNGWKSVCKYDVIYFNPHIVNSAVSLSLDAYYSLDTIMTFRNSWEKTNIFVGLHGGDNTASHGDLDIGNFVISVNGVFMIGELGSENYNVAGYFGNYRFSYYRKRAEGQNTMVMLPHGQSWNGKTGAPSIVNEKNNTAGNTNLPTPDQIQNGVSECLRFETGDNAAIGVVDMAPAYENMTSGIRGMYFTNDRTVVVIQDEATFDRPMDIWWFAHTQGTLNVSEDGRSATIVRSGITLYAEIVGEPNAKFTKMECVSLDPDYVGDSTHSQYYTSDTESSRSGYRKLCIKLENVTSLNMAVIFRVVPNKNTLPEYGTSYALTKIDDWKVD